MLSALETLNQSLFLQINAAEGTSPTAIFLATVLAEYTIYLIPLTLAALWLWGDVAKREWLLKAFCVAMFALLANQLIGQFWQHPRPFVMGLGTTWITHAADSSFPSDHATLLASIGFAFLGNLSLRLGAATLALSLAAAWARVFLGVHFPFDMIGAYAVAGGSFAVISMLWGQAGHSVTRAAV
jgi:undecaprenyl-diphosphatase